MAEKQRSSGLKSTMPRAVRRSVESAPRKATAPPQQNLHHRAPFLVQPKLAVGGANDPFEREADRTADAVMAFDVAPAIGALGIGASAVPLANRAVGKGDPPTKKDEDDRKKLVQKNSLGPGPAMVPAAVEGSIERMSAAGGSPLPAPLRAVFEPRFGYAFADVRLHTGNEAAGAARALGARAFTVGDNVFFGAGEYQPSSHQGQRLIAHELTHTIQQKPAAARAARTIAPAAATDPVPLQAAPQGAQRLFDDTKASIRNKVRQYITRDFPPWDLITLIIGWDPIQERPVKGATRDWIRAAMKLAPDGEALFAKLEAEGRIDAVAKWWDTEIARLNLTANAVVALATKAWDAVSASDIFSPEAAWNEKIKPIFEPTVKRVWDFIKAVGAKILQVVKDLVLGRIAEWAQQQKGYPLLGMVLGKDPVTGVEVKRTAKGLIFAVLDLVPGGEKIKANLEQSKTIEKASDWFSQEVKKLDLTWEGIKALFRQAWDAFKVADLLNLKLLFEKMAGIFGPPVLRLLNFLLVVGKKVLEFVFEGAMTLAGPIGMQIAAMFRRIGDNFQKIIDDPIAFVGRLVDAVKKGIQQFAKNVADHLKTGLIAWLVAALEGAGLVLPKVWDLKGILDLVLQILAISYAKIRVKLVKVLGEKTVTQLESAFGFLKSLFTEGPAAAWQQIVEAIGSLWDMVIGGIKDWAITKIVTAAVTKLVTLFNPAGAVIQAILAIYNTVAFFIERIKQIADFAQAVIESIADIAAGKVAQAASWVERAMARTIPVILGFLARLIGLGDVGEAVKKVITAIQAKVEKGIDAVIKWVVEKAKSLFGKSDKDEKKESAGSKGGIVTRTRTLNMAGHDHTLTANMKDGKIELLMASSLQLRLFNAIDAAAGSPTAKQNPKLAEILVDAREMTKSLNIGRDWKALKTDPMPDIFLDQRLAMIATLLIKLGDEFKVQELTDLGSAPADKRFLPSLFMKKGEARWRLYERLLSPSWTTISRNIVDVEQPKLMAQIRTALELSANGTRPHAEAAKIWESLKTGGLIMESAEMKSYTLKYATNNVKYHVHHEPPVADHWQSSGFKTGDAEREAAASGASGKLMFMTKEAHQKIDHEYRFVNQPWVAPDFKSKYAEGGIPNAKKIDNLPFTDANGVALK